MKFRLIYIAPFKAGVVLACIYLALGLLISPMLLVAGLAGPKFVGGKMDGGGWPVGHDPLCRSWPAEGPNPATAHPSRRDLMNKTLSDCEHPESLLHCGDHPSPRCRLLAM